MTRRHFTTLAPLALLASCQQSGKKIIGVVPMGRSHVFWQSVHAGALDAAAPLGVEVSWNGPANESEFNTQIQIVDSMIARKVDAICLAPSERDALSAAVDRAAAAGIPVVIFDSPVTTQKFVAQVATDNYAAGSLAAQRMGEVLAGKGDVVIVAVQAGFASTNAREKGFEETMAKKFPGIKILDKRYGNADYAQSMKVAENMLTAHPSLAGVFASNESSTAGAVQAMKARASKAKLVGFDSSDALIADLKNGHIDSLITQHPFQMGQEAVRAAMKAIEKQPVERIQNIAPLVVSQANLNDPAVQARIKPDLAKYLK